MADGGFDPADPLPVVTEHRRMQRIVSGLDGPPDDVHGDSALAGEDEEEPRAPHVAGKEENAVPGGGGFPEGFQTRYSGRRIGAGPGASEYQNASIVVAGLGLVVANDDPPALSRGEDGEKRGLDVSRGPGERSPGASRSAIFPGDRPGRRRERGAASRWRAGPRRSRLP